MIKPPQFSPKPICQMLNYFVQTCLKIVTRPKAFIYKDIYSILLRKFEELVNIFIIELIMTYILLNQVLGYMRFICFDIIIDLIILHTFYESGFRFNASVSGMSEIQIREILAYMTY